MANGCSAAGFMPAKPLDLFVRAQEAAPGLPAVLEQPTLQEGGAPA